jgi:hypothetical protein
MRQALKWGLSGLAALALLAFAYANIFVVDEGDRVLIVHLGKIDRVLEPGLHVKAPFIEDRVTFSVRIQRVQYEAIDSYTNDNQVVTSDLLLAYHIDPGAIERIYAQYGRDFEQKLMKELTIGSFRAVMGKVNTVTLASERDDVSDRTRPRRRRRSSAPCRPRGCASRRRSPWSPRPRARPRPSARRPTPRPIRSTRSPRPRPTAFAWPALPKPSACANGPRRFARIRS